MESYVTVAADDVTCIGCLILCNSLKQSATEKKVSVLVYPEVSVNLRKVLDKCFDFVFCTNRLVVRDDVSPSDELVDGDKLKCWLLTDFSKCIFLESDVLVVENIDDLFGRSELSAVADPMWPDMFDAGVFIYEPSVQTYLSLVEFSKKEDHKGTSFQSLLNSFFCNWGYLNIENKIPFLYNCQLNTSFYTHTNALVYFGKSIKVARLGNSVSPVMQPDTSQNPAYDNWNQIWLKWWKIFTEMVKPALDSNETCCFNRTCWNVGNQEDMKSAVKNISDDNIQTQFKKDSAYSVENPRNNVFSEESNETRTTNYIKNEENKSRTAEPPRIEIFSDEKYTSSCAGYDTNKQVEGKSSDKNTEQCSITTCDVLPASEDENNETHHRQQWERGEIDYMGKDCFQNILSQLNSTLSETNDSNVSNEE